MHESLLSRIAALTATAPLARRKVLELMLEDPQRVLDESFEQLAERAAGSVPTIIRACRDLGYTGLRDFKLALAQELAISGSPVNRRVLMEDSVTHVLDKVIKGAASAITSLHAQLDAKVFAEAANAIAAASRVDCYAVGATSGFVASDLQARLCRLGLTSNAYTDYHLQLASAASLGPQGVAIAVSHVGSMPLLLESVKVARAEGATVIALTRPNSPLARRADLVLTVDVPEDPVMHVGTEAYLAHLTVIEILNVLVAQRRGDAVSRLKNVREVLRSHGIDLWREPELTWDVSNEDEGAPGRVPE